MKTTKKHNKTVGASPMSAQKGITLLSLIITIVIMLILATVTVNVVIGGGLFEYASDAVNSSEIANEKEAVQKAIILAESTSKTGRVTVEEIQKAMNKITEANATTVIDEIGTLMVKFNKNNRYYEIGDNGNVEYLGKLKEKILTLQCTDSTGKVLTEKTYTVLNEKYSITLPEIDGYEPAVEKLEFKIEESTTISQLYYMIFNDDTTLVFTGLDASGNITTDESSIVGYMVGDGNSTSGNGLKSTVDKTVEAVLKIPESHSGKPVIQIGPNAFRNTSNIIKVDIGDSVSKIVQYFSFSESKIEEVVLGKNIIDIGTHTFYNCKNLKVVTIKNGVNIDSGNFSNADSWTEIRVDDENTAYKVEDNILYSADGKKLILCPTGRLGEFTIPNTVEVIGGSAFGSCKLSKIIITDNVTTILNYFAFGNYLEEIAIGKNVTSINGYAFYNCKNLKTVLIDSPTIAEQITTQTSCQNLVNVAETIYIKEGITPGSYIIDTTIFTKQKESDKPGYDKYVKNS